MVNDRLSTLSSNEEVFNGAKSQYQEALDQSGYKFTLKYEEKNINEMKKKRKRNRHKRQHWFNPPHSDNLRTNVGEKFINIVKSEFTEDHVLHKIFNKNTIRLSYSCMPNMAKQVSMHNGKVFQEHLEEEIKIYKIYKTKIYRIKIYKTKIYRIKIYKTKIYKIKMDNKEERKPNKRKKKSHVIAEEAQIIAHFKGNAILKRVLYILAR